PMIEHPFSTVEEALEDIRAGRMVVVCDAENREDEGDLVMAAHMATPEAIDFMRRAGRGLICLALTPERCDELGLDVMSAKNEDGTMARVPDLVELGQRHGLRMITVADLIAYRRQHDKLVERVVEARLPTEFGEFDVVGFRSLIDEKHHVAMVKGEVAGADDV